MQATTIRRPGRTIARLASLALLPAAMSCAGSGGGGTAPAQPAPDPGVQFVGVWSGSFEASRFGGLMTMELRLVEGEWTGSAELTVDVESRQAPVSNVEIEGSAISFYFFMDGGDVTARATLANGELTGSLEVYVNGNQVDSAEFRLTKG